MYERAQGKKKLNESGFQDHCKQQQHNYTKRTYEQTNIQENERSKTKKCESFPRTFTLLHILC